MIPGIDESTHWTPGEISFWLNPPPYENGSTLNHNSLRIFSNRGGGITNRITINENGYSLYNGADYEAVLISYDGLGNGFIDVKDGLGNNEAGFYVDIFTGNGTVYGDVKSFRVSHPENENMDIWYACIEGPVATIYDRGTATLTNGVAFIPFSDH